jgi:hypothetical protein
MSLTGSDLRENVSFHKQRHMSFPFGRAQWLGGCIPIDFETKDLPVQFSECQMNVMLTRRRGRCGYVDVQMEDT